MAGGDRGGAGIGDSLDRVFDKLIPGMEKFVGVAESYTKAVGDANKAVLNIKVKNVDKAADAFEKLKDEVTGLDEISKYYESKNNALSRLVETWNGLVDKSQGMDLSNLVDANNDDSMEIYRLANAYKALGGEFSDVSSELTNFMDGMSKVKINVKYGFDNFKNAFDGITEMIKQDFIDEIQSMVKGKLQIPAVKYLDPNNKPKIRDEDTGGGGGRRGGGHGPDGIGGGNGGGSDDGPSDDAINNQKRLNALRNEAIANLEKTRKELEKIKIVYDSIGGYNGDALDELVLDEGDLTNLTRLKEIYNDLEQVIKENSNLAKQYHDVYIESFSKGELDDADSFLSFYKRRTVNVIKYSEQLKYISKLQQDAVVNAPIGDSWDANNIKGIIEAVRELVEQMRNLAKAMNLVNEEGEFNKNNRLTKMLNDMDNLAKRIPKNFTTEYLDNFNAALTALQSNLIAVFNPDTLDTFQTKLQEVVEDIKTSIANIQITGPQVTLNTGGNDAALKEWRKKYDDALKAYAKIRGLFDDSEMGANGMFTYAGQEYLNAGSTNSDMTERFGLDIIRDQVDGTIEGFKQAIDRVIELRDYMLKHIQNLREGYYNRYVTEYNDKNEPALKEIEVKPREFDIQLEKLLKSDLLNASVATATRSVERKVGNPEETADELGKVNEQLQNLLNTSENSDIDKILHQIQQIQEILKQGFGIKDEQDTKTFFEQLAENVGNLAASINELKESYAGLSGILTVDKTDLVGINPGQLQPIIKAFKELEKTLKSIHTLLTQSLHIDPNKLNTVVRNINYGTPEQQEERAAKVVKARKPRAKKSEAAATPQDETPSDVGGMLEAAVNDKAAKLRKSGADAAKNVAAGAIQGTEENKEKVINTVADVAQGVIDIVKEIFDIHSPSGLLKDIAKLCVDGAIIGLKENQSALAETVKSVFDFEKYIKNADDAGRTDFANAISEAIQKRFSTNNVPGVNSAIHSYIENIMHGISSDTALEEFGKALPNDIKSQIENSMAGIDTSKLNKIIDVADRLAQYFNKSSNEVAAASQQQKDSMIANLDLIISKLKEYESLISGTEFNKDIAANLEANLDYLTTVKSNLEQYGQINIPAATSEQANAAKNAASTQLEIDALERLRQKLEQVSEQIYAKDETFLASKKVVENVVTSESTRLDALNGKIKEVTVSLNELVAKLESKKLGETNIVINDNINALIERINEAFNELFPDGKRSFTLDVNPNLEVAAQVKETNTNAEQVVQNIQSLTGSLREMIMQSIGNEPISVKLTPDTEATLANLRAYFDSLQEKFNIKLAPDAAAALEEIRQSFANTEGIKVHFTLDTGAAADKVSDAVNNITQSTVDLTQFTEMLGQADKSLDAILGKASIQQNRRFRESDTQEDIQRYREIYSALTERGSDTTLDYIKKSYAAYTNYLANGQEMTEAGQIAAYRYFNAFKEAYEKNFKQSTLNKYMTDAIQNGMDASNLANPFEDLISKAKASLMNMLPFDLNEQNMLDGLDGIIRNVQTEYDKLASLDNPLLNENDKVEALNILDEVMRKFEVFNKYRHQFVQDNAHLESADTSAILRDHFNELNDTRGKLQSMSTIQVGDASSGGSGSDAISDLKARIEQGINPIIVTLTLAPDAIAQLNTQIEAEQSKAAPPVIPVRLTPDDETYTGVNSVIQKLQEGISKLGSATSNQLTSGVKEAGAAVDTLHEKFQALLADYQKTGNIQGLIDGLNSKAFTIANMQQLANENGITLSGSKKADVAKQLAEGLQTAPAAKEDMTYLGQLREQLDQISALVSELNTAIGGLWGNYNAQVEQTVLDTILSKISQIITDLNTNIPNALSSVVTSEVNSLSSLESTLTTIASKFEAISKTIEIKINPTFDNTKLGEIQNQLNEFRANIGINPSVIAGFDQAELEGKVAQINKYRDALNDLIKNFDHDEEFTTSYFEAPNDDRATSYFIRMIDLLNQLSDAEFKTLGYEPDPNGGFSGYLKVINDEFAEMDQYYAKFDELYRALNNEPSDDAKDKIADQLDEMDPVFEEMFTKLFARTQQFMQEFSEKFSEFKSNPAKTTIDVAIGEYDRLGAKIEEVSGKLTALYEQLGQKTLATNGRDLAAQYMPLENTLREINSLLSQINLIVPQMVPLDQAVIDQLNAFAASAQNVNTQLGNLNANITGSQLGSLSLSNEIAEFDKLINKIQIEVPDAVANKNAAFQTEEQVVSGVVNNEVDMLRLLNDQLTLISNAKLDIDTSSVIAKIDSLRTAIATVTSELATLQAAFNNFTNGDYFTSELTQLNMITSKIMNQIPQAIDIKNAAFKSEQELVEQVAAAEVAALQTVQNKINIIAGQLTKMGNKKVTPTVKPQIDPAALQAVKDAIDSLGNDLALSQYNIFQQKVDQIKQDLQAMRDAMNAPAANLGQGFAAEIDQLDQLRQMVNAVSAAVQAKDYAFLGEVSVVASAVADEKQQLDNLATYIGGIETALNNIHWDRSINLTSNISAFIADAIQQIDTFISDMIAKFDAVNPYTFRVDVPLIDQSSIDAIVGQLQQVQQAILDTLPGTQQNALNEELRDSTKIVDELRAKYQALLDVFKQSGDKQQFIADMAKQFKNSELLSIADYEKADLPWKYPDKEKKTKVASVIADQAQSNLDAEAAATSGGRDSLAVEPAKAAEAYDQLNVKVVNAYQQIKALRQELEQLIKADPINSEIHLFDGLIDVIANKIPDAIRKKDDEFTAEKKLVEKVTKSEIYNLNQLKAAIENVIKGIDFKSIGLEKLGDISHIFEQLNNLLTQNSIADFINALRAILTEFQSFNTFDMSQRNIFTVMLDILNRTDELNTFSQVLTHTREEMEAARRAMEQARAAQLQHSANNGPQPGFDGAPPTNGGTRSVMDDTPSQYIPAAFRTIPRDEWRNAVREIDALVLARVREQVGEILKVDTRRSNMEGHLDELVGATFYGRRGTVTATRNDQGDHVTYDLGQTRATRFDSQHQYEVDTRMADLDNYERRLRDAHAYTDDMLNMLSRLRQTLNTVSASDNTPFKEYETQRKDFEKAMNDAIRLAERHSNEIRNTYNNALRTIDRMVTAQTELNEIEAQRIRTGHEDANLIRRRTQAQQEYNQLVAQASRESIALFNYRSQGYLSQDDIRQYLGRRNNPDTLPSHGTVDSQVMVDITSYQRGMQDVAAAQTRLNQLRAKDINNGNKEVATQNARMEALFDLAEAINRVNQAYTNLESRHSNGQISDEVFSQYNRLSADTIDATYGSDKSRGDIETAVQNQYSKAEAALKKYEQAIVRVTKLQEQLASGSDISGRLRNALSTMEETRKAAEDAFKIVRDINTVNPVANFRELNDRMANINSRYDITTGGMTPNDPKAGFRSASEGYDTLIKNAETYYKIRVKLAENIRLSVREESFMTKMKQYYEMATNNAEQFINTLGHVSEAQDTVARNQENQVINLRRQTFDKTMREQMLDMLNGANDDLVDQLGRLEGVSDRSNGFTAQLNSLRDTDFTAIQNALTDLHNKTEISVDDFTALMKQINELSSRFTTLEKSTEPLMRVNEVQKATLGRKMAEWSQNNTAATEANARIKELIASLQSIDDQGALNEVTAEFQRVVQAANEAGTTGYNFADQLRQSFHNLARYLASFASMYRIVGALKQGVETVKQLDLAMTELRKVSDESSESLRRFEKQSFTMADAVGTTSQQIIQSTADWQRLGLGINALARLYSNI